MKRSIALIWTEGFLDRVAAERLLESLGLRLEGAAQDAGGVDAFWASIGKYNEAAKHCGLILALADHDERACVSPKLAKKLPSQHPNLILRLSIVELEAWLLADSERLSEYLSVSSDKIPAEPDKEENPKQTLVNLARTSTKPSIRNGMVPKQGYSSDRGPEYTLIMESYIRSRWRPATAAKRSPSLYRALAALKAASGKNAVRARASRR